MLGAVACFVGMAAVVKLLRDAGMGTAQTMVWRMAPSLPVVWWALHRRKVSLRPRQPLAIGLRCVFGGLAMAAYFWALSALSLLQHTVLYLAQPVFVAMLAPLVLGERLRSAALVALGLALVGAALAVVPDELLTNPSLAAAHLDVPLWPALMGLASAVCSAAAHLSIRQATAPRGDPAAADAPDLVVFYFTATVAVAAALVTGGDLPGAPASISAGEVTGLVAAMATMGVVGQLLLSNAYSLADAPAVAIVGYARIPLSMLGDVWLWGAVAGLSGWLGGALMVIAGVLLVRSEPPAPPG